MKGNVVWEQDLGDMETRNQFGEGTSPVVVGDNVIINWDHEGKSFITALNKLTGERQWKVPRNEPTSWATPLVIEDDGKKMVLVAGTNRTCAYDPANGRELWSFKGLGLNVIPAPVADETTLFVMSGYREAAGIAVNYPGARGELTGTSAIAWNLEAGMSYVPSPLLYEGKLYFLEKFKGMLSCYELKTGKEIYTKQRLDGLGNIYASPVGAAGRVYIIDREGNAVVFKHGETFELLAENKLDDQFDASPVVVGDELYLRGHEYLYKIAD
jgi:outer membrane protein assembly factor BamB